MTSGEAATLDWPAVKGAVLGASLHIGRHQRAAEDYARAHASNFNAVPSAFFSVSFSAGSKNPEEVEAARRLAETFCQETGLTSVDRSTMKGRLAYTQYGFFTRLALRAIAKKEGGSTDTSRDHEYTDWLAVDQLANRLAERVRAGSRRPETAAESSLSV